MRNITISVALDIDTWNQLKEVCKETELHTSTVVFALIRLGLRTLKKEDVIKEIKEYYGGRYGVRKT